MLKRIALSVVVPVVVVLAVLGVGADPAPKTDPPLLKAGKRYVVLCPSDAKREVVVVEHTSGPWYKVKQQLSDGSERVVWLNLNQCVYFHPVDE